MMDDLMQPTDPYSELAGWVLDHCRRWKDHRDTNWEELWNEYERIYRGIWDASDVTRSSERSRLISPATQQAIETRHSEIMEAIFGNGEFFDIEDSATPPDAGVDIGELRVLLSERLKKDKFRKSVDQITLLAEIYGTGIGEIKLSKKKEMRPATRQLEGSDLAEFGVEEAFRTAVELVPVHPRNFLIDPNATSIDDALGCAIEKPVAAHKVIKGQEEGIYRQIEVGTFYRDDDLEPTLEDVQFKEDKVLMTTYYGLVPRKLLEPEPTEDLEASVPADVSSIDDKYGELVEAIVVIANDGIVLKAERNPYMMEDRPLVAFQDETVPGRFWGRGTAEKAYNMQKAVDAQLRLHFDSLALTTVPMMGMDATRMPRGMKFEVKPGKTILTNGSPSEILQPIVFGQTTGNNMESARELERMLLMATGTIDSSGVPSQGGRDADGGLNMMVASVIKKYKRTLTNFQEDFLIPFINKAAWRYMQFEPETFPSVDLRFVATASLGIIAREHEQTAMLRMLSTLGPDSPIVPLLMAEIVRNSSLQNREALAEQLLAAAQDNSAAEAQMQMQQQAQAVQEALAQAEIALKQANAIKAQAEAQKAAVEAQMAPEIARAEIIADLTKNLGPQAQAQQNFEQRLAMAELALKEKEIDMDTLITQMQMQGTQAPEPEEPEEEDEPEDDKEDQKMQALMEMNRQALEAVQSLVSTLSKPKRKRIQRDERGRAIALIEGDD